MRCTVFPQREATEYLREKGGAQAVKSRWNGRRREMHRAGIPQKAFQQGVPLAMRPAEVKIAGGTPALRNPTRGATNPGGN